jgi:pimeloyl-ACP methyl ester carboxylesterase
LAASRHPVVWISPADADLASSSSGRFAERLAGEASVTLKALEVWRLNQRTPYDLELEVAGVRRSARAAGMARYHLFGFSAGATVALGAALTLGDAILTVTVLEPATIGDDDWDPVEAEWRRSMAALRRLPPDRRSDAFRELLMRPGLAPPAPRVPLSGWGERDDTLQGMLAHTGFMSTELCAIRAPTLVVTGGRSHPRFHRLATRVVEVMPSAVAEVFEHRSHLSPPHRDEPERFAARLTRFWSQA